jgi:hypothetical protein
VSTIGPASIEALKPLLMTEEETAGFQRAADMVVTFKVPAVNRLAR